MTRPTSFMFITGPEVIKAVTGEDVTAQRARRQPGAQQPQRRRPAAWPTTRARRSSWSKLLLSYLPQNNTEDPPQVAPYDPPDRMDEALNTLDPRRRDRAVRHARRDRAPCSTATASSRSTPTTRATRSSASPASTATRSASSPTSPRTSRARSTSTPRDKISRFIRICDAFNIPIVTFVDTPGYLPGVDQEHYGVIRHGAKVIYAYCEATVPKISIVTAQGDGRRLPRDELEADALRPGLRLADGADRGDGRRGRRARAAPARARGGGGPGRRSSGEFVEEYREAFFNPYRAADVGQIDEVIEPRETRPRLVRALEVLRTKVQQNPPASTG